MATATTLSPSIITSNAESTNLEVNPPTTNDGPFNPKKHLAFAPPARIYTMADIGLPPDVGVSPVAVSEPFPLFTREAVMRMRDEALAGPVLENCQYSSSLAQSQLRGYADKYAPFIYAAWKHPTTVDIISRVAGIDLAVQFDLEIGHINLSRKPDNNNNNTVATPSQQPSSCSSNGVSSVTPNIPGDNEPIVGWHTDSYPFVCVVMLSECSGMVGGETELRMGSHGGGGGGGTLKIRSPQMGHAVVLQGRYITHRALRALPLASLPGGSDSEEPERITMVTSFRPRDPHVRDDTVLTTVRPVSDLGELYAQFAAYRLEMLAARIQTQLAELRSSTDATGKGERTRMGVEARRLKEFLREQRDFLERTEREIVDEQEVVKGVDTDSVRSDPSIDSM